MTSDQPEPPIAPAPDPPGSASPGSPPPAPPGFRPPSPPGVDQTAPPPSVVDDNAALSQPTRQSPLAPLFILWGGIRSLSIVNIGFLFAFGAFGRFVWLIPLLLIAGVSLAIATWWRSTFRVEGGELIVERGVLSRERKTIPLERVQSVTIEQNLLHRILGLVEAKVETAGSASAEFTLEAVSRPMAESIRRLAIQHNTTLNDSAESMLEGSGEIPPGPPSAGLPRGDAGEQILLHRTLGDIFKVALSSNPLIGIGTALAAIFGLSELLGDVVGPSQDRVDDLANDIVANPLLLVGTIIAFLVLFVIGALLQAMVPLHELTLFRTSSGLRSASGLLSRRERVAPLERIQLLSTTQNPVQKFIGIRTVTLPTAGSRDDDDNSQIKLPGTTDGEYDDLRDLVLPATRPFSIGEANSISKHAIQRWTMWGALIPVIVVGITVGARFGWIGLASIALLVPAWLLARRTHRNWLWAITDESIEISNGAFTREQKAMPLRKLQAVRVERSLFHRRRGLASVRLSSAAGTITVPHIELDVAKTLRDELLFRCETDPRPHM